MERIGIIKPELLKEEHLIYLDNLRGSRETNIYGASPYLMMKFDLDKTTAHDILVYWMDTLNTRHPKG